MCWHVIRSFYGVPPWSRWTLWNNATKKCFSVNLDIRVVVLINSQRRTCVLQEQMRHATLEVGQVIPYLIYDLVGDEVAPAALWRDDHGPLGPPGGLGSSRRRCRGGGDLTLDGATRAAAGPPGVGGKDARSRAAAGTRGGGGEYGRSRRERYCRHGLTL